MVGLGSSTKRAVNSFPLTWKVTLTPSRMVCFQDAETILLSSLQIIILLLGELIDVSNLLNANIQIAVSQFATSDNIVKSLSVLYTLGVYATDAVGIAFEALVLGFTLFKTIDLKKEAAAVGISTSINNLLIHDGKLTFLVVFLN